MTNAKRKKVIMLAVLAGIMLLFSGCIPGDGKVDAADPAGFFWGIWHGWVAPVSLIISLFRPEIGIYETLNTGFWYDLGFYMAIVSGFGGLGFARGRKKKVVKVEREWRE